MLGPGTPHQRILWDSFYVTDSNLYDVLLGNQCTGQYKGYVHPGSNTFYYYPNWWQGDQMYTASLPLMPVPDTRASTLPASCSFSAADNGPTLLACLSTTLTPPASYGHAPLALASRRPESFQPLAAQAPGGRHIRPAS